MGRLEIGKVVCVLICEFMGGRRFSSESYDGQLVVLWVVNSIFELTVRHISIAILSLLLHRNFKNQHCAMK